MTTTAEAVQKLFGERMRHYRKQRGLTLRDLATRLQTTESSMSRIENGKQNLSMAYIATIADALAVPPHALFGADVTTAIPPEERESYRLFQEVCRLVHGAIPHPQKGHKSSSYQKQRALYQKDLIVTPKWYFV